jgi:hypothetical protein
MGSATTVLPHPEQNAALGDRDFPHASQKRGIDQMSLRIVSMGIY